MMNKNFVIATRWSDEMNARIKVIVGEFSEYNMARIFRDAYNKEYHADAEIVDERYLLSKLN